MFSSLAAKSDLNSKKSWAPEPAQTIKRAHVLEIEGSKYTRRSMAELKSRMLEGRSSWMEDEVREYFGRKGKQVNGTSEVK